MKNLLNLGKALNKAEQKEVFGGERGWYKRCEPTFQDCGNALACQHGNVCVLGRCQCPY